MRLVVVSALVACAQPTAQVEQAVDKPARYTLIRDSAAQMGVHNAALMAGIAISESGLAHCWSEATWACQGPSSPSCSNGPVIAGAADGPCAQMQGGLGMFQFDAGTYTDTVNTYGPQILTVEGNTAQAVWFVIDKARMDISGVSTWLDAAAWMNGVQLVAGDPVMEQWASLLACRYNGCCSQSTTCVTRAHGYRDNAIKAAAEMGAEFWHTADRCSALPAGGVIEERSDCYIAGGDPRYWRRESANDWTMTTTKPAPENFGVWIVKTGKAGRYHVDVLLDGGVHGAAKQATYEVAHAGATDQVMVDQSAASGYVALGDFDFAGTGDEHVMLADNTGEATSASLLFDAIRVQSLDDPGMSGGGCCDTGTRGAGCVVLAGVVALALSGRRTSRRTRSRRSR